MTDDSAMAEKLLEYIQTDLAADADVGELAIEDDLIDLNFIDSMGVMQLLEFIESRFGIEVPIEDVVIENFYSVQAMTTYLQSTRNASDH